MEQTDPLKESSTFNSAPGLRFAAAFASTISKPVGVPKSVFQMKGGQQFWLAMPYTPPLSMNPSDTWNTNPEKLEARRPEIRETTAQTSRTFKISKTMILRNALRSLGCPRLQFLRMASDSFRAIPNVISVPEGNSIKQFVELGPKATGRVDFEKIDQFA